MPAANRGWLTTVLAIVLVSAGCTTGHPIVTEPASVAPLDPSEREALGRIALRMTPPPQLPAMALRPPARRAATSETATGAVAGAARGAGDLLREIPDTGENAAVFALLLPLAMATGAIVGAISANLDDQFSPASIVARPTTEVGAAVSADAIDSRFAAGLAELKIESVDHLATDQQLAEEGFASVIDVVLYTPVVTGNARKSSFVLLHKMQMRSFTDAFATRTWYREQVSERQPADDWFARDNYAIRLQLLMLQANLLEDLYSVLASAGLE